MKPLLFLSKTHLISSTPAVSFILNAIIVKNSGKSIVPLPIIWNSFIKWQELNSQTVKLFLNAQTVKILHKLNITDIECLYQSA